LCRLTLAGWSRADDEVLRISDRLPDTRPLFTLPVSSAADAIFIGESRPQNVLTYVIAVPARFRRLGIRLTARLTVA
jgi:hypothetical protein